jgi:hypothetical protein
MYQSLCSSKICCYRDIVNVAKSEQISLARLVRLSGNGVSEKQKKVDLVTGNPCGYLLVAALGTAQITLD